MRITRNVESEEEATSSCLKPGSTNSSVLNLIAATMGAGTITMPYIIALSGIGLGTLLTILGACLSHYTGNLLVSTRILQLATILTILLSHR